MWGRPRPRPGMLLQRWSSYAADGHGGNVELRELVKQQGLDYVKENFQYSILENYNARMDDGYILKRESWWKETLCTRTHGYNKKLTIYLEVYFMAIRNIVKEATPS